MIGCGVNLSAADRQLLSVHIEVNRMHQYFEKFVKANIKYSSIPFDTQGW